MKGLSPEGLAWVKLCEKAVTLGAAFAEFENARDDYVKLVPREIKT